MGKWVMVHHQYMLLCILQRAQLLYWESMNHVMFLGDYRWGLTYPCCEYPEREQAHGDCFPGWRFCNWGAVGGWLSLRSTYWAAAQLQWVLLVNTLKPLVGEGNGEVPTCTPLLGSGMAAESDCLCSRYCYLGDFCMLSLLLFRGWNTLLGLPPDCLEKAQDQVSLYHQYYCK